MFIFICYVLYLVTFGSWKARQWEKMEAAANHVYNAEDTGERGG